MLDIQKAQLTKTLHMLAMLGCTYAVLTPDGELLGTLAVAQEKKKTKSGKPRGPRKDYTAYDMKTKIHAMGVGEVLVFIPFPGSDITIEDLQGNASTRGTAKFGNGNFTTAMNKTNNTLECMGLA